LFVCCVFVLLQESIRTNA